MQALWLPCHDGRTGTFLSSTRVRRLSCLCETGTSSPYCCRLLHDTRHDKPRTATDLPTKSMKLPHDLWGQKLAQHPEKSRPPPVRASPTDHKKQLKGYSLNTKNRKRPDPAGPASHRISWVHETVQDEHEAVGCHRVVILQSEPLRFCQFPRRPPALDPGRAHPQIGSEQTIPGTKAAGRKWDVNILIYCAMSSVPLFLLREFFLCRCIGQRRLQLSATVLTWS